MKEACGQSPGRAEGLGLSLSGFARSDLSWCRPCLKGAGSPKHERKAKHETSLGAWKEQGSSGHEKSRRAPGLDGVL